jgi:hypothetical protein
MAKVVYDLFGKLRRACYLKEFLDPSLFWKTAAVKNANDCGETASHTPDPAVWGCDFDNSF